MIFYPSASILQYYHINVLLKCLFYFAVIRRTLNTTGMGPLNLEWINYCFVKNGQKHRTDKYSCMYERNPTLVVRRGFPICFYLKFDREFDMANDSVSFMFKLAGNNYSFYYTLCNVDI